MAAFLPPTARDAFLSGAIDWSSDAFLVVLCGTSHTLSEAHVDRADLTDVLATESLTGMTVVGNGVADADDCAVSGVAAALTVASVHIVLDTGVAANDTIVYSTNVHTDGTNIERVGDGNDVVVMWSNGAGRIFQV